MCGANTDVTVLPYSDSEIIQHCAETSICNLIGGHAYGNKVIKIDDELAVKFGVGVTQNESRSQAKAYDLIDRRIVRVPRVHKFFQDSQGRGYLVMEFMKGEVTDPLTGSQSHALSQILAQLASLKSQKPGSLGSGPSCALIFGETDHPLFDTVQDMEAWFSRRLLNTGVEVRLEAFELVLCHLDLFPRNILWLENEPPCVLDWASAGYYPRIFERLSHLIVDQPEHSQAFLRAPISNAEELQLDLILQAWRNIQRYSLWVIHHPFLERANSMKFNSRSQDENS